VKARFSELVREVQATHERVVVTRNGHPAVVLVAVDDLEVLEETLALARDAAALARIAEARAELARGAGVDVEGLRAARSARTRSDA